MTRLTRGLIAAMATATLLAAGAASAAEGDPKRGKKIYNKCKACHTTVAGKNRVGPSLFGIAGRKAATVKKFKYSSAMRKSGLTWDDATLDKYLEKPRKLVPKGKMTFPGLKKAQDRADVIAYIKTFK